MQQLQPPSTLPPNPIQSAAQRGDDERMAIQSPVGGATMEPRVTQGTLPVANGSQTNSPLDRGLVGQRISGQNERQLQGVAPVFVSDETWEMWAAQLGILKGILLGGGSMSFLNSTQYNVTRARIDLLYGALQHKDTFYLVVHQLYCQYDTYVESRFRTEMSRIQHLQPLLEDNGKMHPDATIAFSSFPSSPQNLLDQRWYRQVLRKIKPFLSRLATDWHDIWFQSTHPPLVTDLWSKLELPSPIMMSVMFVSIVRRLAQRIDESEALVKALKKLFWKDFDSCKKFIDAGVRCAPQQEGMNRQLISAYIKYLRLPNNQSPRLLNQAIARSDQIQTSSSPITPNPSHPRTQIARIDTTRQDAGATMPHHSGSPSNTPIPAVSSSPGRPYAGRPYAGHFYPSPGQATTAMSLSPQYGPGSPVPVQNFYPHYSPLPQGQGQTQGPGQWQQMHVLQRQRLLGPVPPSQTHHSPQMLQGQRMQPPNANPPIVQQSLPPRPPDQFVRQHSATRNARPPSNPPAPPHQAPTSQQVSTSLLLPPPGYRAPMTVDANPMRLGLHVADLRDPIKKLVKEDSKGGEIETGLWAYTDSFLVKPTVINPAHPRHTWTFSLTQDERQRFPKTVQGTEGRRSVWTFKPGCQTYRLRCLRFPGNTNTITERSWALTSTIWPSVLYVFVNDEELYVRRKVHNGKDLPLDLTEHLRSGENTLEVCCLLGPDECNNSGYVLAVEVLQIAELDNILSQVQSIPAADSRAAIQKRLSPTIDDDDLAVVTDNLTIGLVDPFMARIFDVPVRSRNCEHHECFDRDTFIRTRTSVSGTAPLNDNWRCPICKADARPRLLVVDNFLAEVHAELARTNRLDTATAIQIKADGTWTLRVDADEPSAEAGASGSTALKRKADDSVGPAGPNASRSKTESIRASPVVRIQEPEIIELD
ncbi:hypothetical protein N7535_000489 [Penicillium sp. DV-2018c]|nr:hypothetical protein N7535_000489 [Penicillium sp. DV-2018c]